MTGIAFGALDIPKISMGDTPIVKVSMGDTLVWPSIQVSEIDYVTKLGQTTSTASGTPCAWPTSAIEGDVIIFIERMTHNTAGAVPPSQFPPGFTQIHPIIDGVSNTCRYCSSYRVVTAQDTIDQTPIQGLPQTATSGSVKYAIHFRGYKDLAFKAITSVEILESDIEYSTTAPSNQVMSNSAPKQLLNLATYSGLAINPRTWTGTSWDEELNVGTSFYVKYNASDQGSPVTVGMPDNSNNNVLASMTVLFY